ncbi:glutathione S-transferase [Roseateles paludis]|uniref:Glutathione S-transferase n=1 Tax=Roseateles paludis TaxID=3145238 RepID=A0ABV0FYA5_9BURK
MQLIGMLDSPYVRRVAIVLRVAGVAFEHRSISVFRQMPEFSAINPVIKAPTLVTDAGTVLMDSTLILGALKGLVPAARVGPLWPAGGAALEQALRCEALALAACEKSVQQVYETQLRPTEHQHGPWLERVRAQMFTAYDLLEAAWGGRDLTPSEASIDQPAITAAVTWSFTQDLLPGLIDATRCPRLAALAAHAERLPAFQALPMH